MWSLKKGNKYGAIKTEYGGGRFDSKKEARKAMELDLLKKGGMITDWETHKKLPLDVNGYHIANYYVDFIVYHNGKIYEDGTIEYLEIKAPITMTPVFKIKWKLLEALVKDDPNIKMTIEM